MLLSQLVTGDILISAEKKKHSKKSIHQEEAEKYAKYNFSSNEQWEFFRTFQTGIPKSVQKKEVHEEHAI
jgi:hypothetical protein